MVNDPTFGVALSAKNGSNSNTRTANVDYIKMTITYEIDTAPPTVVSIVPVGNNPTNSASKDFTVTFSENVTGGGFSNFSLTPSGVSGATITSVTGSGSTRTVTVNTGTGEGTIRADLADATGIADLAGNAMTDTFSGGTALTVDRTAPHVVSITPASSTTSAASMNFNVTFSESVLNVAAGNFTIVPTGVTGATLGTISGSGTTWTVPVNTGSGNGTISLDLGSVLTITDIATNALAGTFTTGDVLTVLKPVITATAGAGGTITPSGPVTVVSGANQAFSSAPGAGYLLSGISVDGGASLGALNDYTLTGVTTDHTIAATFDSGWFAPTSVISSNSVGTGSNGYTSDGSYISINNGSSDTIQYGFGTIAPTSIAVDGIEVAIEANKSGTSSRSLSVDLSYNNGSSWTTPVKTVQPPSNSPDQTFVIGSPIDLWGRTFMVRERVRHRHLQAEDHGGWKQRHDQRRPGADQGLLSRRCRRSRHGIGGHSRRRLPLQGEHGTGVFRLGGG